FMSPIHVQQVEQHPNFIEVHGLRGRQAVCLRARVGIIATGASTGLLVRMGLLKRPPPMNLAVRAYFDAVAHLAPHQIQFRFDGVPLPGYGWIFPTSSSSANIGLGIFATHFAWRGWSHPAAPRAVWEQWLQAPAL